MSLEQTTGETSGPSVAYNREDRQWDARFNLRDSNHLLDLVALCMELYANGRFQYVLVGGAEIGTNSKTDDYQKLHVHCAFIFRNRISKASILRNLDINEADGYYLVPRNRSLPYSGWRSHHIKAFSKIDPEDVISYEAGELPKDIKQKSVDKVPVGPEEKKRKLDEILLEMRELIENDQCDEAWKKFPRNYLTYGEKIKAMVHQKRDFFKDKRHPNIWLHGYAGTGKTALLSYIYPDYYKKNLSNRFFDLFDPVKHSHIMLEDLDHQAVEALGINFLKTICDEAGFPIDQKYKTPQLIQSTCLVTSNFTINEILQGQSNTVGLEQNLPAMLRRFYHVRIDNLLHLLGLKLLPVWDRKKLQKEGNCDMGKLFITWDYVADAPLCLPIRSPEHYQEVIRNHYYA